MSKTFTFQTTKQKLTVDKEAFSLLQSWQEAVMTAFSDPRKLFLIWKILCTANSQQVAL